MLKEEVKTQKDKAKALRLYSVEISFVATLHRLSKVDLTVLKLLGNEEDEYLAKVQAMESGTYLVSPSLEFDEESREVYSAKVIEFSSEKEAHTYHDQPPS
uniref:Uncharacterized protein n=1 Tax=Cannabis sativa TaxID=3483 RepID=A0A803Q1V6_CANSA